MINSNAIRRGEKMIRVLCVDDNPHDLALIQDALKKESERFTIVPVTDRVDFEKAMGEGKFDVVLSDFNILGYEGLEIVRKVKERFPDIPVIVVTSKGSEEIAVAALKQGADDYVTKTPGHITQLPHTIRQVLESNTARQKLKQREKNLQTILDNISDGILVVDQKGTILYANPAALEMFGNPEGGLVGKSFGYPMNPGSSVDIELPLRPGGTGTTEMCVTNCVWENKDCYIVVLHDITEYKKAEKELTGAKEYLIHLFNVIPILVYTLDPKTFALTWVSPNITRILGYSAEEILQPNRRWWEAHIHPEDKDKVPLSKSEIRKKGHLTYKYRLQKKNGNYIWIRDEVTVIYNDQGNIVEIVGVCFDITQEKQLKEEQEKLEEQLRQAQRLESIGRLASSVAHDFNNILSVILGYGEIIHQMLHPSDPLKEKVEQIIKAAERATDLTRQLLAFSRKQVFQLEVVNLNEIVKNMEKMLRRLIEEHIELEFSLAEDLPYVKVDPAQIEQVIMNLVVNARDAMPTGGKLTIETREATLNENDVRDRQGVMPGKYVVLAVTDTGCGMDKEVLPYIFEPFFTTKEKGKGTGLGLSTVYGIVKQSGGDIRVHSKPGKGSRFEVYIPVTNEQPKEIVGGVGQGESLGKGEKILVVEDEAELRELMEQILSSLGYKVILASNGEEALSKVSELRLKPDLLITDVIMPVMNGRQLVEHLKRKYPDLKVIYISGYSDDITAQMGVLESEASFIQKPFNIKDIAEKVWKVLHEKGNGKLQ